MDNTLMWIWWALTVAICAWKIGEGFVRPSRMLEWPFLACAMWGYFYGYMAYNAKVGMPEYLGNGIANIGQLMPLLCLMGLLAGWALGTRRSARIIPLVRTYPYFNIWLASLLFLVVGVAGSFIVMSAIRGQNTGFNIAEASGYYLLFFYVGYPGLAIALWALCRMELGSIKYLLWFITLATLAAFMFPHLVGARRGPLYPAVMILLLVPPMARRRSPNPIIFTSGLVAAALVMFVFLQVRDVTYNGGSWTEALHRLDVTAAVTDRVEEPEDNEYINNCQLIGTIYQNGKYQYGTGHLSLLWHWIPRAVWKDKPMLGEGSYSFEQMFDDVESATGFHLLGGGAAAAGVADSFVQYGILCPFYWLGLSWGLGAVYVRARLGDNPRWLFCYIGFICASHWLVSQGLAAASVPCAFFQVVPVVIFMIFGDASQTHRVATNRRPGSRAILPNSVVSP